MEQPKEFVFDIPVGAGVATRANTDGPPAVPKDAATVALVREGAAGMEMFLLRRVTGMAFAGGMTVFPGGGVDRRDADTSVAWVGPEPAWWGSRFGCDPRIARALVCAAVRETFEESGVLLAGKDDAVVADAVQYADGRHALVNREVSLAQFLADAGLVLRADLLRPWANWVTPGRSRAATTPGSSWRCCPRASTPTARRRRRRAPAGSARRTRSPTPAKAAGC